MKGDSNTIISSDSHKLSESDILFLIKQELQIRRLIHGLEKAGIYELEFKPHLDKLILSELGMDACSDETMDFYYSLVERRCKKLRPDQSSILKQSFKVYKALIAERARRIKS